jgi:hypothetical protein
MRTMGLGNYQGAQAGQASRMLGQAPAAQSIFGPQAGKVGLTAKDVSDAAQAQALAGLKREQFTYEQARDTTNKQVSAKTDAQKMYNDFVTTDQAATQAKSALQQAQANPTLFAPAAFAVGKALGVTSRNPQLVVQAITAGDPSLGGKVAEMFAKGATGKVTPELLSGLNNLIDQTSQSNKQGFETKASAHAQQNAGFFNGDVNAAKQQLYPNYQWSNQQQGGGGNQTAPTGGAAGGAQLAPNEVSRKTQDGKTAIFDATTKKFLRYQNG